MQFGLSETGNRIPPSPNGRAKCPNCKATLIAKCGSIVMHHWAHESTIECDSWWESEGEWHRNHKNLFPEDSREVVIGRHRADVFLKNLVVELQKSQISITQAIEREDFYGNMIWVFYNRWLTTEVVPGQYGPFLYAPRMNRLFTCLKKPIFIDVEYFGNRKIFRITKIDRLRCYGYFLSHNLATAVEGLIWKINQERLKGPYLKG